MSRRSHYSFILDMGKNWGKTHAEVHLWKGQSKTHKFWLLTVITAFIGGFTWYFRAITEIRDAARANIIYHPVHGVIANQSTYKAWARQVNFHIVVMAILLVVGGIVLAHKLAKQRRNQEWAAIADAARQAKSAAAN